MEKRQTLLEKMTGSNHTILAERSSIIVEQAKLAQKRLIDGYKAELSQLQLQLNDLTDLAPTNTTSLKVESKLTKNPDLWVKEIHDLDVAIALKEDDIKIAELRYDMWFPNN